MTRSTLVQTFVVSLRCFKLPALAPPPPPRTGGLAISTLHCSSRAVGDSCGAQSAGDWIIETVAGTGIARYSGDGGAAVAAQVSSPYGVALDGAGNLYIADTGNHRIRKVNSAE